jgi:hypothetical protein
VPAFPSLWSPHDEAFHHRRRYRRSELRDKIGSAGFRVERLTGYSTFLFPPLYVFRKARSLFRRPGDEARSDFHAPVPAPIGAVIDLAYRVEAAAIDVASVPFGVSFLALARKSG